MKIDMNIISVMLIIISIFPYFLLPYLQYRLDKRLKVKFQQEIKNHRLNLDMEDSWNLNIIGADFKQNRLLFVQRTDETFCVEIMDLSKVRDCTIRPEFFKYISRNKEENILQRVNLEFSLKYEDKKIVWNLYDCDVNYSQDLEMKHAEKWCSIIREQLTAKPILKHTA